MGRLRGFALPLVIWGILITSVAVVGAVLIVGGRLRDESLSSRIARARELAMTGIAYGLHPAITWTDPLLTQEISSVESFQVDLTPEGGKCPINEVLSKKDLQPLTDLFTLWGADAATAAGTVAALADWVDVDEDTRAGGAESSDYLAAGRSGLPLNRNFQSLDEMAAVKGMDVIEQVRPDWRDFFTIWGPSLMDIHAAPAELLAAFGGISLETAQSFVRLRNGHDGISFTDDDQRFTSIDQVVQLMGWTTEQNQRLSLWFGLEDHIIKIESHAEVGGLKKSITVIAEKQSDGQTPSKILVWQEN